MCERALTQETFGNLRGSVPKLRSLKESPSSSFQSSLAMYCCSVFVMIKEHCWMFFFPVFSASGEVGQPIGPGPGVPSGRPVCPGLCQMPWIWFLLSCKVCWVPWSSARLLRKLLPISCLLPLCVLLRLLRPSLLPLLLPLVWPESLLVPHLFSVLFQASFCEGDCIGIVRVFGIAWVISMCFFPAVMPVCLHDVHEPFLQHNCDDSSVSVICSLCHRFLFLEVFDSAWSWI